MPLARDRGGHEEPSAPRLLRWAGRLVETFAGLLLLGEHGHDGQVQQVKEAADSPCLTPQVDQALGVPANVFSDDEIGL